MAIERWAGNAIESINATVQIKKEGSMKGLVRVFAAAMLLAMVIAPSVGGRAMASKLAMPTAKTVTVELQDFKFVPATVNANVGDIVTFVNKGATAHTATAGDGSWDSGNLDVNATFNHTFTTAGSFIVYCKYHGSAQGSGMFGTVVVAQGAPAATATSPAAQPTATTAGAAPTATTATAAPTATAAMAVTPTAMMGTTPTAGGFMTGAADSVTADDQPAGSSITVKAVHANENGWITVHANTADNKPGAQLGHTAVKEGDNFNVVVQLSPVPAAGDKVWPMLHIDAGVIGTYEFPGPDAPVIINGNIIMKQITLTGAAPTGGNTGTPLPNTGNSAADLWLVVAMLGLLLIASGAFVLRRRNA